MEGKLTLLLTFLPFLAVSSGYELKQVVILSRHNIRAPLSSKLNNLSNNPWPVWDVESGFLTAKGALLEKYIGNYVSKWLIDEGLLHSGCPSNDSVFIYANTRQRTRETAKAFVSGAFDNCNVYVYSKNSTKMDPVFNPIIRNNSLHLKTLIYQEMQKKLDGLRLDEAYAKLNEIIGIKDSNICRTHHVCDLLKTKDDIVYQIGEEPNVNGPLELSNSLVDAFLMSYYEGMDMSKVAWGKITSTDNWKLFTRVTSENQNVRFNSTVLAKEVAKPLLKYIYNIFNDENSRKFTLMVGHDANLNSVMAAIGFEPYVLPEQYEFTPLGGKLVFQKWHDNVHGKFLMKVDYVYQTVEQLRNGQELSDSNPPRWASLSIKGCVKNNEGFCPWNDFIQILKNSFIYTN